MKTKEELNALKNDVETLNKKLHELTEEELKQVSGGDSGEEVKVCKKCGRQYTGSHICESHICNLRE